MYISRFQLRNLKCFDDSGELTFLPGFNVIVGPNNAGKTTLLEGLSLSLKVDPLRRSPIASKDPEADVTFVLERLNCSISCCRSGRGFWSL